MTERISALHIDQYDLNMPYAWWKAGLADRRVQFDVYFRKHPFGSGFTVFAGLERIVHYLENLRFTEEDIAYLRNRPERYDEGFLDVSASLPETSMRCARARSSSRKSPVEDRRHMLEAALVRAVLNIVNWHAPVATRPPA